MIRLFYIRLLFHCFLSLFIGCEAGNGLRSFNKGSFNINGAISLTMHIPGNQHDFSVHQFKTCDSPGVNAASGVKIGCFTGRRKFWSVCMAADNHNITLLIPFIVALFYLVPFCAVFRWTCSIFYTHDMQELPYVAYQNV